MDANGPAKEESSFFVSYRKGPEAEDDVPPEWGGTPDVGVEASVVADDAPTSDERIVSDETRVEAHDPAAEEPPAVAISAQVDTSADAGPDPEKAPSPADLDPAPKGAPDALPKLNDRLDQLEFVIVEGREVTDCLLEKLVAITAKLENGPSAAPTSAPPEAAVSDQVGALTGRIDGLEEQSREMFAKISAMSVTLDTVATEVVPMVARAVAQDTAPQHETLSTALQEIATAVQALPKAEAVQSALQTTFDGMLAGSAGADRTDEVLDAIRALPSDRADDVIEAIRARPVDRTDDVLEAIRALPADRTDAVLEAMRGLPRPESRQAISDATDRIVQTRLAPFGDKITAILKQLETQNSAPTDGAGHRMTLALVEKSVASISAAYTATLEKIAAQAKPQIDLTPIELVSEQVQALGAVFEAAQPDVSDLADGLTEKIQQTLEAQSAEINAALEAVVQRPDPVLDLTEQRRSFAGFSTVLSHLVKRVEAATDQISATDMAVFKDELAQQIAMTQASAHAGMQEVQAIRTWVEAQNAGVSEAEIAAAMAPMREQLADTQSSLEALAQRPDPVLDLTAQRRGFAQFNAVSGAFIKRLEAAAAQFEAGVACVEKAVMQSDASADTAEVTERMAKALETLARANHELSQDARRPEALAALDERFKNVEFAVAEFIAETLRRQEQDDG